MHPPAGSQVSRVPAQRTPPDQVVPEPAAPPPPPRRRLRTVLAVVAGVMALLCLGGAVVAYVLYDNYTAPDRSAPDVVVDNYLRAYLVDRNDVRADLFTCENSSGLAELQALRTDLQGREERFKTQFVIKWGPLKFVEQGDTAEVRVKLSMAVWVDSLAHTSYQSWRFVTRLDDAWRVCEAHPVP